MSKINWGLSAQRLNTSGTSRAALVAPRIDTSGRQSGTQLRVQKLDPNISALTYTRTATPAMIGNETALQAGRFVDMWEQAAFKHSELVAQTEADELVLKASNDIDALFNGGKVDGEDIEGYKSQAGKIAVDGHDAYINKVNDTLKNITVGRSKNVILKSQLRLHDVLTKAKNAGAQHKAAQNIVWQDNVNTQMEAQIMSDIAKGDKVSVHKGLNFYFETNNQRYLGAPQQAFIANQKLVDGVSKRVIQREISLGNFGEAREWLDYFGGLGFVAGSGEMVGMAGEPLSDEGHYTPTDPRYIQENDDDVLIEDNTDGLPENLFPKPLTVVAKSATGEAVSTPVPKELKRSPEQEEADKSSPKLDKIVMSSDQAAELYKMIIDGEEAATADQDLLDKEEAEQTKAIAEQERKYWLDKAIKQYRHGTTKERLEAPQLLENITDVDMQVKATKSFRSAIQDFDPTDPGFLEDVNRNIMRYYTGEKDIWGDEASQYLSVTDQNTISNRITLMKEKQIGLAEDQIDIMMDTIIPAKEAFAMTPLQEAEIKHKREKARAAINDFMLKQIEQLVNVQGLHNAHEIESLAIRSLMESKLLDTYADQVKITLQTMPNLPWSRKLTPLAIATHDNIKGLKEAYDDIDEVDPVVMDMRIIETYDMIYDHYKVPKEVRYQDYDAQKAWVHNAYSDEPGKLSSFVADLATVETQIMVAKRMETQTLKESEEAESEKASIYNGSFGE